MKIKTDFFLGLLVGLVITLSFTLGILLWNFSISGSLFPLPPVSTGLSNPPTPKLDELARRVDKLENDQTTNLRDIAWKMDQKLLIVSFLSILFATVTGFFGIKTYTDIEKVVREKTNAVLEKELYQLDPTNLPIRVVGYRPGVDEQTETDKHTIERIRNRLKLTGLKEVKVVDHLTKSSARGISIVMVTNRSEEQALFEFLNQSTIVVGAVNPPDRFLHPGKAAIIVYTGQYKLQDETLDVYSNLVTANMPVTVANMVLVVGRGLKNILD